LARNKKGRASSCTYRTPQHVNGDFHWFLRTRFFDVMAWVVITALLTLDVPWKLLQQHIGQALAQSTIVLGPENFVRTNGAPQTVTRTFNVSNLSGTATLCLANGGANNQFGRVSSATVTLNNTQVLRPNDFNQQVASLTRTVTLTSANTLQVRVASVPGSGFTLAIVRGAVPIAPAVPIVPLSPMPDLTTVLRWVPSLPSMVVAQPMSMATP
jgi:hypothetical protein